MEALYILYGQRLISIEERLLNMCPTEVGEEFYYNSFKLYFNLALSQQMVDF